MQSCRSSLPRRLSRQLKRASLKPTTTQMRTMAFFPRNFYNSSDSSFTPLFRLLDDFDNYSRQGGGYANGRRPSWQPKFDVRETGNNYDLQGELPGVDKENVHIEFTDPQTMVIRGHVERTYTSGTPPAGHIGDTAMSGAIAEGEELKSPHKATVEDEDANAAQSTSEAAAAAAKALEQKQPGEMTKYWLTERSIGDFSRSFNFPTRIDQDAVAATFKDGILTIVVPKAKKHESRRIAVN